MGTRRPILIVDDNPSQRERWYDLFSGAGLAVFTAQTVAQTRELFKHERLEAILVNARLRDQTGWEFAAQIRAFDATIPIILLGDVPTSERNARLTNSLQACLLPSDVPDEVLLAELIRRLKPSADSQPPRWRGTILVVDDEVKIQTILKGFLERHGLTVVTAASGEEALKQLLRASPAVVLLDIKMAGMDGLLTLKKLKTAQPTTTVIMMTGLEDEQLMSQAFELGAYEYLTKPFDLAYLESVLLNKLIFRQAT